MDSDEPEVSSNNINTVDTRQLTNHKVTQPLSEADRLAQIFEDIDSCADSGGGLSAILDNHSRDRTYTGRHVSKEFNGIIFDNDDDKLPSKMDSVIAMTSGFQKASNLYYRYKFLIGYLEAGKGTNPTEKFIQEIRQDIEVSPHWQISPTKEVYIPHLSLYNPRALILSTSSSRFGTHFGMFSISPPKLTSKPTTSKDKSTASSLPNPRRL